MSLMRQSRSSLCGSARRPAFSRAKQEASPNESLRGPSVRPPSALASPRDLFRVLLLAASAVLARVPHAGDGGHRKMSENRGSVGNLDPTARVAPPRKQAGGGGQSAATETTPVGDVELGLRSGTDEPEEQPQHTEQDRGSGSTDEHEHENKDKEFIQQELRRRADFSQSRISSQESVVLQATGFLVVFLGVLLSATAQSTGDLHCGNKWTVVTLATVVAFFYLAFVLVTYGDLRKQYAWQEGYRERSTRDKPPTIKEAKSEVEDVSFPTVFLKNDGKQLRPSFQPGPDNPYLYGSLIFLILPTIVVVLVIVSMVHILCDKQPGSPSPAPSSGKAFVPW